MLAIVGPDLEIDKPPTTLVASEYVVSANQPEIPTISYFCESPRPRTTLPNGMTAEMYGLVSLTYSLIRQLIELLPSSMSYPKNLREQRFNELRGGLDTYGDAIAMLGELLDLSPPMIFCVIDGLERLDDSSAEQYVTAFVDTFHGHRKYGLVSQASDRALKVLFTTAGRSRTLLTDLEEDELVFAEQAGFGRRPGRPSAGRRSLSPATLGMNETRVNSMA